jgi:hypothetical protein
MNARLARLWRRFRTEAVEAWTDTNQASALLKERQQTWRTTATLRWVNTGTGPRLVGSVLPSSHL